MAFQQDNDDLGNMLGKYLHFFSVKVKGFCRHVKDDSNLRSNRGLESKQCFRNVVPHAKSYFCSLLMIFGLISRADYFISFPKRDQVPVKTYNCFTEIQLNIIYRII